MFFKQGESTKVSNFRIYYIHNTHGEREILSSTADYRIIDATANTESEMRYEPIWRRDELHAKVYIEGLNGYNIKNILLKMFQHLVLERLNDNTFIWWVDDKTGKNNNSYTIEQVFDIELTTDPIIPAEPEPEPEPEPDPEPETEPEPNLKLIHLPRQELEISNPFYEWNLTIDNDLLNRQFQGESVDYVTRLNEGENIPFIYSSSNQLDLAKSRIYVSFTNTIGEEIDFRLLPVSQPDDYSLLFEINTRQPISLMNGSIRELELIPEIVAIEIEEPEEPIIPNIDRVFKTYALDSDEYLQLYVTGFDERYSTIYESTFNKVFEYPYNPITDDSIRENIIIGAADTGATAYKLESNQHVINFDKIDVPELYGDSRDYEGVEIQLFLPFHNEIILTTEQVINQSVYVQYVTDLSTGDFTLNISSSISDKIIYTSTGTIGKEMPLYVQSDTGRQIVNEYRNIINNQIYNPYIEVTRQIPLSSNIGFNTRYDSVIGNESGYIIVDDVQLSEPVPSNKRLELMNLLRQGVIIND